MPDNTQQQLEALIRQWERRLRVRRTLLYVPRVLIGVLLVAIVVTVLVVFTRALPLQTLLWIIVGALAAAIVATVGTLSFLGQRGLGAAQQFDQIYGLQERLSTALELISGRIQTTPEIAALQIADAYELAQEVDPRKHIKLNIRWLEWLLVGVLGVVLGLFFVLANISIPGASVSAAQQQAIESAAEDVRDIIEDVATDTSLADDARETLLESLEVSLDDLQMPETSPEEAFASMSALESDLRAEVEDLQAEIAERQQALDDFAAAFEEALNNMDLSEFAPEDTSAEGIAASMEELLEAMGDLSPEQQEQLAEMMQQAAEAALEEFPELSEQLMEAAEAFEASDSPLQNEALQEALDQLQQQLDAQAAQETASDALESAADAAQQAAENIAQAEQEAQQSEGQAPQDAQQQADEGQSFQAPEAPEGAESSQQFQSEQSAETNAGQQSQQAGQQPQAGEGQPQNQSEGQPSQAEQGQLQQGQTQGGEQATSTDGSDQSSSDGRETEPGISDDAINTAESTGEREYDPIFAPRDIAAGGRDDVVLEPDASDAPVVEGDFNDNPDGDATVPYDQVFSSYSDAANRALENEYVPLGLRDVVRDYFTALEPEAATDSD